MAELVTTARCLRPGCDWTPPEDTDAGKAAERHTAKDKHPTATVTEAIR